MNVRTLLVLLYSIGSMAAPVAADPIVAPLFSTGMVIQREVDAPIWGQADPGETITVRGSWGQQAETKADDNGRWTTKLATPKAGGPFTITISGKLTVEIEIENVLAGDVWLCTGQSNMAGNVGTREQAAQDNYDAVRHTVSGSGTWNATTPETVRGFTAVGYFFGRHLHRELGVPIGLIKAAAGGTLIEPWSPKDAYEGAEGSLYQRHIAGLVPFAVKGAIWYQGEANSRNESLAAPYAAHLQGMIRAWRANFGQGDFPFYYVQLPSIASGDRVYFMVREAMRRTLGTLPNVGMSINIDIDEGLHPASKHIMGPRLAMLVLRDVYGKELVASGPLFESLAIEGDKAICTFTETGTGLVCRGDRLSHFEIAGADGNFVEAEATLAGDRVIVSSGKVSKPAAVRYAWSNNPKEITLFNKEGLPASPFTSGE